MVNKLSRAICMLKEKTGRSETPVETAAGGWLYDVL